MKDFKSISKLILLSAIMVMASFGTVFGAEPKTTVVNLIGETTGYTANVSGYVFNHDYGGDVMVIRTPEKNNDGSYTLFEIATTDEEAHMVRAMTSIPDIEQIGEVYQGFKDNKVTYKLYVEDITDLEGKLIEMSLWVLNKEEDVIFDVGLTVTLEDEKTTKMKSTPASKWAVADIEKAKEYYLVTPKTIKDLQGNITREEFCELAIKLYEALTGESIPMPTTNKFTDTKNTKVLKADALSIISGVSETEFAPDASITREQMAIMLYRTLKAIDPSLVEGDNTPLIFTDKDSISDYAQGSLTFMSNKGILGGVGENKVNPKGTATKEQSIIMVKRVYEKFNRN